MSELTESEAAAMRALGYAWLTGDGPPYFVLEAYRAGFRDGRQEPERPRVFRQGDPEPGPETTAVMDRDGEIWSRHGDRWGLTIADTDWYCVLSYGPLVHCSLVPRYDLAVRADDERRAAAESAGGAR